MVSARGLRFLERIGDYAVGGMHVTPATESYGELKARRAGLGTVDSWESFEAVHINAAEKSLKSAYRYLHIRDNIPKALVDRVLVMDFDMYYKSGKPKVDSPVTMESVVHELKRLGMCLPYCIIESGTKGNFHVMWVFKFVQSRGFDRSVTKDLYRQWGCDEKFTNSTMRNPIFLEAINPGAVHWWSEWSSEEPLLDNACSILKDASNIQSYRANDAPTRVPEDRMGKFKYRMSLSKLESVMTEAGPGDGRWLMLRSWTTRFIMSRYDGTPITHRVLHKHIHAANKMFKVPMEDWRVSQLIKYWTPFNQACYVARQHSAGASNPRAVSDHEKAVLKYWDTVTMQERLDAFLRGSTGVLTAQEAFRVHSFRGDKQAPNKRPTHALIASMLGVSSVEKINKRTGEVVKVSGSKQVRHTLSNGKTFNYSYEEYLILAEKREEENRLQREFADTEELEEIEITDELEYVETVNTETGEIVQELTDEAQESIVKMLSKALGPPGSKEGSGYAHWESWTPVHNICRSIQGNPGRNREGHPTVYCACLQRHEPKGKYQGGGSQGSVSYICG